jgi:hypothetical protein
VNDGTNLRVSKAPLKGCFATIIKMKELHHCSCFVRAFVAFSIGAFLQVQAHHLPKAVAMLLPYFLRSSMQPQSF